MNFSFPLQLNMSGYMEKNLIPTISADQSNSNLKENEEDKTTNGGSNVNKNIEEDESENDEDSYLYELIGVTVHTGTAEGGHYYSFIRERDGECVSENNAKVYLDQTEKSHKWYVFKTFLKFFL